MVNNSDYMKRYYIKNKEKIGKKVSEETMRYLFLLVAILFGGCADKKCAIITYEHLDGTTEVVSKCFDISVSSVNEGGFGMSIPAIPSAEQQRFSWLTIQRKEDVSKVQMHDL